MPVSETYFRCLLTSFVISNIETSRLPPKTSFSFSSARILRMFFGFWSLCFLMYTQSFFTTWVRGRALVPTTAASFALVVRAFMKAAFGLRFEVVFFFVDFFFAFLAICGGLLLTI